MGTRRSARSAESHLRDDRGAGSLELAVVAPSLLLLIFFLIQSVLWFYARSVALQAARDGVSQLRLDQLADQCEADRPIVGQQVADYASRVGSGALTAASVVSECHYQPDGGSFVTVTVRGEAISLIGFTMHVTQTATGQVEQFQTGG